MNPRSPLTTSRTRALSLILALALAAGLAACAGGGGTTPTIPANPANLAAQTAKNYTVALTWKASSGPQMLQRKIADGNFDSLADVTAKSDFEDFPVSDGITYTYRVTSTSGVSETTVTVPAATPNPLTVTFTADPAKSAKATLGQAGGSLSATGANGVVYTLTVPPSALLRATEITLTPISQVSNLPLSGGLLGAVRIEPEDLELYGEARLTMTKAAMRPSGTRAVAFTSANSGQEFHLLPFSAPVTSAVLRTQQQGIDDLFPLTPIKGGTYGAGAGTPQDVQNQTQRNPPTDPSAQTQQQAAAEDDDLAPLATYSQVAGWKAITLTLKELNRPSRDTLTVFREFRQWLEYLRKHSLEAEFDSNIKAHSRRQATRIRTRFDELYKQCEAGDRKVRKEMRELLYWGKLYPAVVQNLGAQWIGEAEERVKRCGIPNWEGAVSASQPEAILSGYSGSAEITYTVQDIQGDLVTYASSARNVRFNVGSDSECSASVPSAEASPKSFLQVDYGVEPARYFALFFVDVTYTIACRGNPPPPPVTISNPFPILFPSDTPRFLSNNNRLMSDSYSDASTYSSTWTLNAVPRTTP